MRPRSPCPRCPRHQYHQSTYGTVGMLLRMSVTVRGTGIYLSLYTATLSVREAIFHVERAISSIGLFQRQHSVAGRPGSP